MSAAPQSFVYLHVEREWRVGAEGRLLNRTAMKLSTKFTLCMTASAAVTECRFDSHLSHLTDESRADKISGMRSVSQMRVIASTGSVLTLT